MRDAYAFTVSIIALLVSIFTLWLTQWRRGNLRMTRPVMVGFLYELPVDEPKIFLRSMLFATGKRGHIVESLFLKVRCGEFNQTFDFWRYGETQPLMIGSGLRVTEDGIASYHHFLPSKGQSFRFASGDYVIEVYGRTILASATVLLRTIEIRLTEEQASDLSDKKHWVLFTWGAESEQYRANVDTTSALLGPGA